MGSGGKQSKPERGGRVRKRQRANSANQHTWWKKLSLPRRGKKESLLSPAPLTSSQEANLARRREKLEKALCASRTARAKHMAVADWDAGRGMATVASQRGSTLQSMGVFEGGVQHLLPEEALFLVDRGVLDLRVGGRPVSLQQAWGMVMSAEGAVGTEAYLAFAHLRRAGYVVRRAERELSSPEDGGQMAVDFSAWRVGAYRRKETPRPLFHVAVFTYDAPTPSIGSVKKLLDKVGKTRVRVGVIDRGVVVFTDLANNATPLSDRFKKRFVGKEEGAGEVGESRMGEVPKTYVVDAKTEPGLSDVDA